MTFDEKGISQKEREEAALRRDADIIARFGAMEQLDAHGRAGTIRTAFFHEKES